LKKNILLINPWIYDFTAYDFWMKPLGLLYVAALLKKNTDFAIHFIDCLDRFHPLLPRKTQTKPDGRGPFPKEEVSKPEILRKIPRKFSRYGIPLLVFHHQLEKIPVPDLVLLTCTMTYWYPGVQTVVELIRKKFGSVPVILGGVYPSLMPKHALKATGVDAVCQGPGERQILLLINEILGDGVCPSLCFDKLEDIPPPAFDLLRSTESLPLLTSRGCPLDCSFCASSLLHKGFEQRSPSSVLDELKMLKKTFRPKHIAFYDDALLMGKKRHIIPLLKGIIQEDLSFFFHTPNGLHVGEIDFELASFFKRAGFRSLYLSQESLDEKWLRKYCPKAFSEDLNSAVECLEKVGFQREKINVYLLIGLPSQNIFSIQESILRVKKIGARPRLAYYSPIPGTKDWKRLVAEGYMDADADPLLHNKLVFPYVWGAISPEEFESLKMDLKSEPE
jgi:radical SAM superfamily enzyme YgiQ (UPF0313 family)